MKLTPQLIQRLCETTFCRPAISELAEGFENTAINEINTLVAQLTEQGEDVALNRLLNVCAYADIQLDPTVLAESTTVIADMTHLSYCYVHQGPEAIDPLIKMARADALSYQRQALLGRLAAELALRHQTHKNEVDHLLQYLCEEIQVPSASILIFDSIHMLEKDELKEGAFPIMTEFGIHADLPQRPPPKIIGGGETMRRPLPKLGRNEPCHCGSGKKYKRCCIEKDQAILADASSYEGVTQSQLAENPGIVDDAGIIRGLRAYEIKKLIPENLTENQLMPAYQKACGFGLLDVAFSMLDEYSKRPDLSYPFDPTNFLDLMELALAQNDMELAQRARARIPQEIDWINWEEIDFQFDLHTHPGHLETIEARCKEAFCCLPDEKSGFRPHGFCDLAHLFRDPFPALSILFARAALQECPDRLVDNDLLVENVHQARIELGLSAWEDPIDTWFNDQEQAQEDQAEHSKQAEETELLRKQLAESRAKIREAETGLRTKEALLTELKDELKATSAQPERPPLPPEKSQLKVQEPTPDTVNRLRHQIENLKAEIGNQQEKRQKLRGELNQERKQAQHASPEFGAIKESIEPEDNTSPERPGEAARTLLIPEYHNHFRDACQSAPAATAVGAMKAITSFAVYDPAVWRNARRIKQLTNIYRVRIGRNYRLLLCWNPGQNLTALDLIPRQDLESWIRRHA